MKHFFALFLFASVGVFPVPAFSNEPIGTCIEQPIILSLANKILEKRRGTSLAAMQNFGDQAAYLIMRYGDLSDSETITFLDRIETEKVPRAARIKDAYLIANGLRDPKDVLFDYGIARLKSSAARAMILRDDGALIFSSLRNADFSFLGKTPGRATLQQSKNVSSRLTKILSDLPDETRLKIALAAERAGGITAALTLLADQSDLTAYREMVDRYPDHFVLHDAPNFPESFGASLRSQKKPLGVKPPEDGWRFVANRHSFEIARVDYWFAPFNIFRSLSSTMREKSSVTNAAIAINHAIDSGAINPIKRTDAAWIYIYLRLVEQMGQQPVDDVLNTYFRGPRRYLRNQSMREIIHRMIATGALWEYVLGFDDAPPIVPPLLANTDFDWERWAKTAEILRNKPQVENFDNTEVVIALELAFSVGWYDLAIALADRALPKHQALIVLKDFIQRLDQHCAGFLWMPGSRPGSLYRFPISSSN